MRQNAAQLNRMQIREQEALNRQRRLQDDAAARREQQAVRRTQAQYDHVASRGYGRSDAAAGTPDGRTAGASSSHGPAGAGSSAKRSGVNANVAHGDDVQIKVYVRECDGDAGHVFTYREGGPATATATASGAAGGARAPRGTGGPSTAAASSSPPTGGRQAGSGGVTRGPGIGAASKADGLVAPNRARVPHYLQQRKAEMAAEKEALAAEAERQRQLSQIPPGHRRVSEEEKADTLRCLDERQQELETQLAKIPIRFDTQSIQQRRRAIEDELRELEAKRNKYSTKNPLYVPLS
ncbi:hypothetical protein ABL78_3063 [Leptomonas seymouri]|uniref:Enkurin domain-containing protein n=1 Tax=Leptomonas seymouri TaxID=5684 RepID=A0A0N0P6N2_LEPSE|nr:hypothetical protein ABL78_3063 [Leptomonas seymouri]|eukprot:KPI87836.1 hypothetical protein ABL78_3063 [Leptomonas seymouri]